jgi:hypothetical protein
MQRLGPVREHFWLVRRMADAANSDLGAAMAQGRLSHADWAGMVNRCRACPWADRCKDWLDAGPQAGEAPGECANRVEFAKYQ